MSQRFNFRLSAYKAGCVWLVPLNRYLSRTEWSKESRPDQGGSQPKACCQALEARAAGALRAGSSASKRHGPPQRRNWAPHPARPCADFFRSKLRQSKPAASLTSPALMHTASLNCRPNSESLHNPLPSQGYQQIEFPLSSVDVDRVAFSTFSTRSWRPLFRQVL